MAPPDAPTFPLLRYIEPYRPTGEAAPDGPVLASLRSSPGASGLLRRWVEGELG